MYKYCILAHMKNTTPKAPRNVFIHVTGPFTKSGQVALDSQHLINQKTIIPQDCTPSWEYLQRGTEESGLPAL